MRSDQASFIVKSERILVPDGLFAGGLLVENGRITHLFSHDDIPANMPVVDEGSAVVMPGLVDTHVHINEPGRTDWEGFQTGTRAAAAGGVTTIVDMPLNSDPVTTSVDAFERKRVASEGQLWVDCGFYAGVVPGNTDSIGPLLDVGVLGVKAFLVHSGINDFPAVSEEDLRVAMPHIARCGTPLLVHAELTSGTVSTGRSTRSYAAYCASRPPSWEERAISAMIELCREFACRVHIVHLAAATALPMIEAARAGGLPLTVETCPHYLFYSADEIPDGDTRFKCSPPIRDDGHRRGLWEGLRRDAIDFIVTDHSPCPPALKCLSEGDFFQAWGGIASIQLRLPVVWTAARARGFSLADLPKWLCSGPAELIGLTSKKGFIKPGADADLVVWRPEATFTVSSDGLFDRHKLTPYEGETLFGVVDRTYLGGRVVYDRGQFIGSAGGSLLLRT